MKAELADIAKIFPGKRVLVLPHANADPDALGSAVALSQCMEGAVLGLPGGVNRVAKNMLKKLGLPEPEPFVAEDFDWVLCVDCSLPQLLGPFHYLGQKENVAVLDHHVESTEWPEALYYTDESKGSCAEIVYDLLGMMGCSINREAAMALMAGMYSDTVSLRYATLSALRAFISLAEMHGLEPSDASAIIAFDEREISERISHIKAAQRTKMVRVENVILLSTRISAFEGSTARLLMALGADMAFVGSQNGKKVRISGRARKNVLDRNFHMGRLMEDVAGEVGGSGGGHDGAAGLNTTGEVEAVLHICMEKAAEILKNSCVK